MSKEVSLRAEPRKSGGKGPARQVRMAGNIPGVIYGPEIEPIAVSVSAKDLRAAVKESGGRAASSTIFDLKVGETSNKVLIRDLQRDPVTSHVIHIDFHAISMNRPINIEVPIHLIGIPIGVKAEGGIMQTTLREVEISCLPLNIPDAINVDVSELAIGDSIHVSDLKLENVELITELGRTIVVVSAPSVLKSTEEEAAEEAEEAAAEAEGADEAKAGGETEEKKE